MKSLSRPAIDLGGPQMARDKMLRPRFNQSGRFVLAVIAIGFEGGPRRAGPLLFFSKTGIGDRDGREQLPGVGVQGMFVEDLARGQLHDDPQIHDGGPVGIGTIAASISEDRESIEEVIEPYLIQIGFLNRTPRGRVCTAAAYKHFGFTPPALQEIPQALAS